MSDEKMIQVSYRVFARHIRKVLADAETMSRLTGSPANQNATIRAMIEEFDPAEWARRLAERAAERAA